MYFTRFLFLISCLTSVSAFLPSFSSSPTRTQIVSFATQKSNNIDRKTSLTQVFGGVALAGLLGFSTNPTLANAGWLVQSSPEVIDPKDAVIDTELLKSTEVQTSIKDVKTYRETVSRIAKNLKTDTQYDMLPEIRQEFEFSKLRNTLNQVNTVFDEDTQKGTDRLVRVILQDVNELGESSRMKSGYPRSDKKAVFISKKLAKLEKAFGDLLDFF